MNMEGLKEKEVLESREKFGRNVLSKKSDVFWFFTLIDQLKSPIFYILLFAALISLIFKEYFDFILIILVVVFNTILGFYQEYRAERRLVSLRKILKSKALVIREGERKKIDIENLVKDDLVVLGAGDQIPADGFLIEGFSLLVQEAILTGESESVEKKLNDKVFMGTQVVSGRAIMKVEEIGDKTEIGKIGKDLIEIEEKETNLQRKLKKFTKTLVYIIGVISVIVFLLSLFHNEAIWSSLKLASILAVATIPEGLPIVVTVVSSVGMRRILKKKGLTKKLSSVEGLGAVSMVCIDKTGTITLGATKVTKTDFLDREKSLLALFLNNEQNSNLEMSIWNYLKEEKDFDLKKIKNSYYRIYEELFDSVKKYSLTINSFNGKEFSFILGAPEIVIQFSDMSLKEKENVFKKIDNWAEQGLKMIGILYKEKGDLKKKENFKWLGLIGINDPIRKEAKEAIDFCLKANIGVKIITGDHRKTAEKVAENLGFQISKKNILNGEDLSLISDKELEERIEEIFLFSRVNPRDKLKIVKALQKKGEVVAMMGDGVNDVLALEKADVGIAVENASDISKQVADLILLDSNFKTLTDAISEGRLIFNNIKKTLGYMLSDSFSEVILILGAMFLSLPFPLSIIQILWIRFICEGPSDILLGFEPKEKDIMKDHPKKFQKGEIFDKQAKLLVFIVSFVMGISALIFFSLFLKKGDLSLARTISFATISTGSLIYVFSFRNLRKPIFKMNNFFKNKALVWGVIYSFILLFGAIYLPFLNKILGTIPLNINHWLLILGIAIFTTLLVELTKMFFNGNKKEEY